MTTTMSKQNQIHRLIASKSFSSPSNSARTKIVYAICSITGYDGFYDYMFDEKKPLEGLSTKVERVQFFEDNREHLMDYAQKLATKFCVTQVNMLEGMSYKEGSETLPDNTDIVTDVFINNNRSHDEYENFVDVLVENVCIGVAKASAQQLM